MNRNRINAPRPTAASIGRMVEDNLTNFIYAAMREIRRPENSDQQSELLEVGLAAIHARMKIRDGIKAAELQRLAARTP